MPVDVVKRGKKPRTETFDPGKLYASIFASCISQTNMDGLADQIARQTLNSVLAWCGNKSEITSNDIRLQAAKTLGQLHPEVAYIYKNYQQIL